MSLSRVKTRFQSWLVFFHNCSDSFISESKHQQVKRKNSCISVNIRFYSLRVMPSKSSLNFSFTILSLTARGIKKKTEKITMNSILLLTFSKKMSVSREILIFRTREGQIQNLQSKIPQQHSFPKMKFFEVQCHFFFCPTTFIYEIDLSIF